jgi:hypothetical protein
VLVYTDSTLTNKGENIMISLDEIEELSKEYQEELESAEQEEE